MQRVSRALVLVHLMSAAVLAGLAPSPAEARPGAAGKPGWRPLRSLSRAKARRVARQRSRLIRGAIQVHRTLRTSKWPVQMPKSDILSDKTAAAKRYGDSWTCRESTRALISELSKRKRLKLTLDSSGKDAFRWGKEGLVSYHYYGVDNPKEPTVLVDPTAFSNFHRDAAPGGLLHELLQESGRRLGQPAAARRVARRIAAGGVNGLLVLANKPEIAVYREALEQAAKRRAQVRRNQERSK